MPSSILYKQLSDENFGEVLSSEKSPMIVVFSANWSGNAVIVDTIMEKIVGRFRPAVEFYKTDIEENPSVRKFFNITSVPTLVFMENGEIRNIERGFVSKKKIIQKISESFSLAA